MTTNFRDPGNARYYSLAAIRMSYLAELAGLVRNQYVNSPKQFEELIEGLKVHYLRDVVAWTDDEIFRRKTEDELFWQLFHEIADAAAEAGRPIAHDDGVLSELSGGDGFA